MRHLAGRLVQLLIPLVLLLLAAAPGLAAPASEADMSLYTRIAAINVCLSRAAGVAFDQSVAVAGETIAQEIQGQHGGRISQVGARALSLEELRKGSINSALLGAVEVCPQEVPAEVRERVEALLKEAPAGRPKL